MLIPCFPGYLPCSELTGANLKTCEISLVQIEKIGFCHLPEFLALTGRYIIFQPLGDISSRFFPVHVSSHHITHELT